MTTGSFTVPDNVTLLGNSAGKSKHFFTIGKQNSQTAASDLSQGDGRLNAAICSKQRAVLGADVNLQPGCSKVYSLEDVFE